MSGDVVEITRGRFPWPFPCNRFGADAVLARSFFFSERTDLVEATLRQLNLDCGHLLSELLILLSCVKHYRCGACLKLKFVRRKAIDVIHYDISDANGVFRG